MNDEELIGYLLGALDASSHAAVEEELRDNADAAARLEQLRLAFAPLEADREPATPAPALAVRTVARLAHHLVENGPRTGEPEERGLLSAVLRAVGEEASATHAGATPLAVPSTATHLPRAPREEPESRAIGGRSRPDLIIASGIAFLACGLMFAGVNKVRARNELIACQANLQALHVGLAGYADTHDGRYPQVGTNATADFFATTLAEAGQVPAGFRPCCPAAIPSNSSTPPLYAYTLGFQTPAGGLLGLRRPDQTSQEHDLLPISADYPSTAAAPTDGPVCPHGREMNVLYAGGNVRVTTSPFIGPNADDIYRNTFGQVAAGTGPLDVVLGRPGDRP